MFEDEKQEMIEDDFIFEAAEEVEEEIEEDDEEVEEEIEEEVEEVEEEVEETKEEIKSETKEEKITIDDIQKKLNEESEKRLEIEKQLEENKKVQDNSLIIGQIDNELAKINLEANQLLAKQQGLDSSLGEYKKALAEGRITLEQYNNAESIYNQNIQAIRHRAYQLAGEQEQLYSKKVSIPTPQDFIKKQQVIAENDKFYSDYEAKIEDNLVKKHINKLKRDHYDEYGVELSKATDWDVNVKWIEQIVKESEARGFQKAQEKITEKQAKGKIQAKANNTQGSKEVVVNLNNLNNLKKKDVNKALTFY